MSSYNKELHVAALKGDWHTAKTLNMSELRAEVTDKKETALHVAAYARKVKFVENLVNQIVKENDPLTVRSYLETENTNYNTALCYAAATGDVRISEIMVEAHRAGADYVGNMKLKSLPNLGNIKPLHVAASSGHCDMVKYLFHKTNLSDWSGEDRFQLFTTLIAIHMCEEALEMLELWPELGVARNDNGDTALRVLARKPSAFVHESQPCLWRRITRLCMKSRKESTGSPAVDLVEELYGISLRNGLSEDPQNPTKEIGRALMTAAEKGNGELVIALMRMDPNLMWKIHEQNGSIFHIAIRNRYQSIFNLCYELGSVVDMVAQDTVHGEDNMLHLAAKLAPQPQLSAVSGAALQMQRELVWYKEVEKIVKPCYREQENAEGKTPPMLFSEEHKDLMRKGEKWMKETANSSMVVAALIATVMFTTAFTVPGGYNNNSGEPMFQNQKCFLIFFVADALGLFCSSTSILMFHSIITSRYAEDDFLESLPFRLMVGVASLFISVASMMVAFCATFPLYYPRDDLPWSFAIFGIFACVPSLYVSLKYPLLVDLIRSTYDYRFMFRSENRLF